MSQHKVADVDEIDPGERKITVVAGQPVGVFHLEGGYYAIENRCAHQGGPVCTGMVQQAIEGEFQGAGERVSEHYSEDVEAITCPWHGWEYDIRTGHHLGSSSFGIETFDVTVESDGIYINLDEAP